jgi:hypothetical protein
MSLSSAIETIEGPIRAALNVSYRMNAAASEKTESNDRISQANHFGQQKASVYCTHVHQ